MGSPNLNLQRYGVRHSADRAEILNGACQGFFPQSVESDVRADGANVPDKPTVVRRHALMLGLLACGLILGGTTGCRSQAPTAQVETARRHLQLNRPRLAVEALVKEDSAEGHYLKAVALQTLGEKAAARDQIGEALSIDSEEPKYRGYEALLDLNAGKKEAAQKLMDLYDTRPSSPALAFFATRAYVEKGDVKSALRSFKLGLTLIDEAPEFMYQALQHAVVTEQADIARQLLEKLQQAAPQDVDFLRDLLNVAVRAKLVEPARHLLEQITAVTPDAADLPELQIKMELLLDRSETALTIAHQTLQKSPNDPAIEILLAEALLRAEQKPERERELAQLAARHPENPHYLRRHVLYLAKSKRLPEGLNLINQAIARAKVPTVRATLLNMAIRIPLEEGDATLAEQQLNLHRAALSNPLVADYFMGRILYLKRDYLGAVERFQKVIESPTVEESEAGRLLRAECTSWQQQIISTQTNKERLRQAQEELKKILQPKKAKKDVPPAKPDAKSRNAAEQPSSKP